MKNIKLFPVFLVSYLIFLNINTQAQNSVLTSGEIYKLAIPEHGIYKIDRQFLVEMGIDVTNLDPQNIHIFGNSGGMLPQPNSENRPVDLIENAIHIEGEKDGSFDDDDFILFYAEGANRYFYDTEKNIFNYENNLYETTNFYFLKIDDTTGKRIQIRENLAQNAPTISTYNHFDFHEKDIEKIEQDIFSGREWFGEEFGFQEEMEFDFSISDIVANSDISVYSGMIGRSTDITIFSFFLNDNLLGSHRISSVTPLGIGRYDYKGRYNTELFSDKTTATEMDGNLKLKIKFDKQGVSSAQGYIDFILVNTERKLKLYGNETAFRSLESTKNQFSNFQISEVNTEVFIWDVTTPQNAISQSFEKINNSVNFTINSRNLHEFRIFQTNNLPRPIFRQKIENQNLHGLSIPDFVIISHPDFRAEAERLAEFRKTNDNLETEVVTTTEIYHEFSSGRQDVTAIRDFIRFLYQKSKQLKYVLLFGDASFDYKNRIPNANNFVPVYQSRESLHPIYSYASDDYYGFMDESEGFWGELNDEDEYDLEIGIGRLPIKSEIEATNVVNKLMRYDNPEAMGNWRNQICFVADDADYNLHFDDTEKLTDLMTQKYEHLNLQKLYVDAFPQVLESVEKRSPVMRNELKRTIENGTLLVNFVGHGSETSWTSEQIFDFALAGKLKNPYAMPLIVTATCEFGRFDYHAVTGAEYAVLNPNGGAIALLTTTRPVYSNTNAFLTRAFYNAVFEPINGKMPRLGDVLRITKNNSLSGIRNRNFSLLGDPSMRLAYPQENIKITSIKTESNTENTLKALDKVKVTGEIQENNQLDINFDGKLEILVFDKSTTYQTLGDEDPDVNLVADYQLQDRKLFKGAASVQDGKFEFEFVVPKDIDYQLGTGKISLYAQHQSEYRDAGGFSTDFQVGGTASNIIPDNNPPEIQLFMDSTNFKSGDRTGTSPKLLAFFTDESGINLTGNGLGHDILAILDGEQVFVLNDFYEANLNTYQKGSVIFPFENLSEGEHHLKIQVWDTHNHFSEAELTFVVKREDFAIRDLVVYPNPFVNETQFSFLHNRAGEDLKITLDIYEPTGKLIRQVKRTLYVSAEKIENLRWDGTDNSGNKLRSGLYIYRLKVRPDDTNEISWKSGKLLILK